MGLITRRREKRRLNDVLSNNLSQLNTSANIPTYSLKLYKSDVKIDQTPKNPNWKLNQEISDWTDLALLNLMNQTYKEMPKVNYYDLPIYEETPIEDYSSAGSFGNAFRIASNTGADTFYWDGAEYNTKKDPNWKKIWGKKGTINIDDISQEGSNVTYSNNGKNAIVYTKSRDLNTGKVNTTTLNFILDPTGTRYEIQPKVKVRY